MQDKEIVMYDLLVNSISFTLAKSVNEAIQNGAVPFGSPGYTGVLYYQAVVYYKEKTID